MQSNTERARSNILNTLSLDSDRHISIELDRFFDGLGIVLREKRQIGSKDQYTGRSITIPIEKIKELKRIIDQMSTDIQKWGIIEKATTDRPRKRRSR